MRLPLAALGLAAAAALAGSAAAQASYTVVPDAWNVNDITPDGSLVVGRGVNPLTLAVEGYIWDWRNDPTPSWILGDCDPIAISNDGTVVAGQYDIDLDGFISLAVDCKNDIQSNAELFRVTLEGTIDCKALLKRALDQYRSGAIDAALDLDSLIAVVEGDYS